LKPNHRYYDFDAIIAVGYRVNSYQATQFRIWATKTLRVLRYGTACRFGQPAAPGGGLERPSAIFESVMASPWGSPAS
jgi:hypothetical protein